MQRNWENIFQDEKRVMKINIRGSNLVAIKWKGKQYIVFSSDAFIHYTVGGV